MVCTSFLFHIQIWPNLLGIMITPYSYYDSHFGYEQKFLFRKTQFPRQHQDSHLCTYAHLGRRDVKFQGFYKSLRASPMVLRM